MQQSGAGDKDWQQAMLDHLNALYCFAMTLTNNNSSEAEELVQETYTRATRHYQRLRPDSNLKGWMFIIMRNTWLKQQRRARIAPVFVAFEENQLEQCPADPEYDPHALCVRICERNEIRAALNRLPRTHREIIILRDIEELSYKQIADILDCPLGTIMSRLARARAKLKQLLCARRPMMLGKTKQG